MPSSRRGFAPRLPGSTQVGLDLLTLREPVVRAQIKVVNQGGGGNPGSTHALPKLCRSRVPGPEGLAIASFPGEISSIKSSRGQGARIEVCGRAGNSPAKPFPPDCGSNSAASGNTLYIVHLPDEYGELRTSEYGDSSRGSL